MDFNNVGVFQSEDSTFREVFEDMGISVRELKNSEKEGEDRYTQDLDHVMNGDIYKIVQEYNNKIISPYNQELQEIADGKGKEGLELLYMIAYDEESS